MLRDDENIQIYESKFEELDWVNQRYKVIDLWGSNYENEIIHIACINGVWVALGRLVNIDSNSVELGGIYVLPQYRNMGIAHKIVSSLVAKIDSNKNCFCLAFENLSGFYRSFGFTDIDLKLVPLKIQEKYQWCLSNYDTKTLLLVHSTKEMKETVESIQKMY